MTDDGSGGSAYAGPRVRVRRGRRAKFPTRYLVSIGEARSNRGRWITDNANVSVLKECRMVGLNTGMLIK